MNINYSAVFVATVVQFVLGAVWYTPIFGNLWGKMHGFDKKTKAEQDALRKGMAPLLFGQFIVTIVTTTVFAYLITGMPLAWSVYGIAGLFWLGFVVPTQVSGVLFGGTEPQWIMKKIAVLAGGSLLCLEAAAFVLQIVR